MISVSVVSHGQAALVEHLIQDIQTHCGADVEVLVTVNIPEQHAFGRHPAGMRVRVIENDHPKGFGANHNSAFEVASGEWFCVINPDIRFARDPLRPLCRLLSEGGHGCAAPLIRNPRGEIEDSARRFPTPWRIAARAMGLAPRLDFMPDGVTLHPDWVGGMFMLFPRSSFSAIDGFDDRYFLYYEDVDLCWRLRRAGQNIVLAPTVEVIHDARRQSRRDLRYLRWHLVSMARYFAARIPLLGSGLLKR